MVALAIWLVAAYIAFLGAILAAVAAFGVGVALLAVPAALLALPGYVRGVHDNLRLWQARRRDPYKHLSPKERATRQWLDQCFGTPAPLESSVGFGLVRRRDAGR